MLPLVIFVSYCSNEREFISRLLTNATEITKHVFVSIGERLYNGAMEDEVHVSALQAAFPEARFVRYSVDPDELAHPVRLHNKARIVGVSTARRELLRPFWAMFLDGDEVPDAKSFCDWWAVQQILHTPKDAAKLANYWYFLKENLVADQVEDSIVMVHSDALSPQALQHFRERDGILMANPGLNIYRLVYGIAYKVMFHHYSWVRSNVNGLIAKTANWGHSKDRPWASLIQDAMNVSPGMPMTFASIEDVWSDAASILETPSSASASASASAMGSSTTSKRSDPLCDVYQHGYSSAMDDIMDTYTPGNTMSFPSTHASVKTSTATWQPNGFPLASMTASSKASDGPSPVDYTNSQYSPFDGSTSFVRGKDAPSGASLVASGKPKPTPTPAAPASEPEPPVPLPPPVTAASSYAAEHAPVRESDGGKGKRPAEAFNFAAYVVSGVMLIFIMEVFLQIGMRMRPLLYS